MRVYPSMLDRLSIVNKYRVKGNKVHITILVNSDFLAFLLYLRKYAYKGSNLLQICLLLAYLGLFSSKKLSQGLTIMEIPDEIIKEIRESGYDQELVYTYIRELLDSDKEYDV